MRARALFVIFSGLLFFLPGCTHRFPLVLDKEKEVRVYNPAAHSATLRPGTDAYQKFGDWLAKNQSGWERYLATPPGRGWIAYVNENYHLQFLDDAVLLQAPDGVWVKHVAPDDYSFLMRTVPEPQR